MTIAATELKGQAASQDRGRQASLRALMIKERSERR